MTLYDFNGLDETEQITVMKVFGTEIGKRSDQNYNYILYQIDSFYAEKRFYIEREILNRIRSFSNPDLLEPYLGDIDISEIT